MASYTVQQGDCLASIAASRGMDWKTVWEHPDNKPLRDLRKNPNILQAGDVVEIPDKKQKQAPAPISQKHEFKVKLPQTKLRFRVLSGGKAVASVAYKLLVDKVEVEPGKEKKTGGDGLIVAKIPAMAKKATVSLAPRKTEYEINLGHLDPVTATTGLQTRLLQLGFYPGKVDGEYGPFMVVAVWLFQCKNDISPTGKADEATLAAVEKAYGM